MANVDRSTGGAFSNNMLNRNCLGFFISKYMTHVMRRKIGGHVPELDRRPGSAARPRCQYAMPARRPARRPGRDASSSARPRCQLGGQLGGHDRRPVSAASSAARLRCQLGGHAAMPARRPARRPRLAASSAAMIGGHGAELDRRPWCRAGSSRVFCVWPINGPVTVTKRSDQRLCACSH
jgi:hypothetical protein